MNQGAGKTLPCLSGIFSGVLLALAYPLFNLELLAFFAFVPLFIALKDKNSRQAFLISYICGLIFFIMIGYWLIHVTLIGQILLIPFLALYFGLFGVLFKLLTKKSKYWIVNAVLLTIAVPAAWILLEWLRSTLFPAFAWALLGYSQYLNLPMIQIADKTSVWGVSFLVMMVNVAVWEVIEEIRISGYRVQGTGYRNIVKLAVPISLTVTCVIFVLVYGFYRLRTTHDALRTTIKVSVIQGNIPQDQKWDKTFADFILKRYQTLTEQAAKDNPDLIIWPETSVPGLIDENPQLLAEILKLAKKVKAPILIGAVTLKGEKAFNSAVLISAKGKITGQYDKLRLVPFGEYVPLEKTFPSLRKLIGIPIGDFTPGAEYTVFGAPCRFSALICFEDIFPWMSKRFVKNGAAMLVNITNDAWFKRSSAPYQHAQASVFRAIENRVPVVRAANTGLSCFIDPVGRIYDKVAVDNKDIFVVGYKTQVVQVKK